jgi:hypothetical protein
MCRCDMRDLTKEYRRWNGRLDVVYRMEGAEGMKYAVYRVVV